MKRLIAVVVGILVICTVSFLPPIYAMGQAPSTCSNRYDGNLTSMVVASGQKSVDVISHPGSVIYASKSAGYDVTFTVKAASISSQGNTQTGQVWYDTNANGFFMGVCGDVGGAGQTLTATLHISYPSNFNPSAHHLEQGVVWDTWSNGASLQGSSYNIVWRN